MFCVCRELWALPIADCFCPFRIVALVNIPDGHKLQDMAKPYVPKLTRNLYLVSAEAK